MPPISTPQNTRATLITWLVVFVILFVVAAVFAIYYDVQWNKSDQSLASLTGKYKQAISDQGFVTPEWTELTSKARSSQTAFDVLVSQRHKAAQLITGNDKSSPDDVDKQVKTTLEGVAAQLKTKGISVTLPQNLLAALRALGDQAAASADASAKAQGDAKAAEAHAVQVTQEREKLLADKDKQIAAVTDDMKKLQEQIQDYQNKKNLLVEEIQASAKLSSESANKRAEVLQGMVSENQKTVNQLNDTLHKLQAKLDKIRLNPNDAMQQPDGVITRVPGNGTVFISVGQMDSVTPGLTFEVYDKHRGLPKLVSPTQDSNGNDTDLPAGKASIEVIRILPGTSECRIVRTAPGQIIAEGDLIENLVYDPHTKYNFFVYGNFDISQSGTPNPSDAELIKRLVTQWGGKLQPDVTVDTDFVVLGKEPAVPILTEEDKNNPLQMRRYEDALKAMNAYQDVLAKATQLHVPILNQNRFLYFTGYYDQARR